MSKVNYGLGAQGDVTLSANTTLNRFQSYQNLVIDAGVTVTLPFGGIIQVSDTLTVNGTIDTERRIGSAASGGSGNNAHGGDAGGTCFILAQTIEGSGTVRANGENGDSTNANGGSYNSNWGAYALPPAIIARSNSDGLITDGARGGQQSAQDGYGRGGSPSESIVDADMLNVWLEDWFLSGGIITKLPMAKMMSGGGAGGGEGGGDQNNDNNAGGGGGGGAGGSFGGRGGAGSPGENSNNYVSNAHGKDGAAGGGAGGLLVLLTDDLTGTISYQAIGGNGGNAGGSNNAGDGGGGGGAGGGVIVAFTPGQLPNSYDVSGGTPGNSNVSSQTATPGEDGILFHFPLEMIGE